jgi:hypothetical protein
MSQHSPAERHGLINRPIKPKTDLTGRNIGKWTVLEYVGRSKRSVPYFRCRCDCGKIAVLDGYNLGRGQTLSCGHDGSTFKHGMARRSGWTGLYRLWHGIKNRCLNKNATDYKDYGGRGIKVCERWMEFANFVTDMGERPSPKHTVGRKDNNGPYSPENCRWETMQQQGQNKRNNLMFVYQGENLCLSEISRRCGISFGLLKWRLLLKRMSIEEAVSLPVRTRGGKK